MGRSGMIQCCSTSRKRKRHSRRVKRGSSFGYAADVEMDNSCRSSRSENSDDSDNLDVLMKNIHESRTVKAAGFFEDVSRHHKKRVRRLKRLASLENYRRNMRWKVNGNFSDSTASVDELPLKESMEQMDNNPPSILGGIYSSEYATSAIEAIANQCSSLYGRNMASAVTAKAVVSYGGNMALNETTAVPISDGDHHVDQNKPAPVSTSLPILSPRLEDGLGMQKINDSNVTAAAEETPAGCCCDSQAHCHWCSSSLSLLLESMSCGQTVSSTNSSTEVEGTAACESFALGGVSMTYEQALALSREPRMLIEATAPHRIVHANRALHDTLREQSENVPCHGISKKNLKASAAAEGRRSIGESSATSVIGRPMTDLVQLVAQPSSPQCTSSETKSKSPMSGSFALSSPTTRDIRVIFPSQMKNGRDGTVTADCSGSDDPAVCRKDKKTGNTHATGRNEEQGQKVEHKQEGKKDISICENGFCVCIHPVNSCFSGNISSVMECPHDATHFLLEFRSTVKDYLSEGRELHIPTKSGCSEYEKLMFAVG